MKIACLIVLIWGIATTWASEPAKSAAPANKDGTAQVQNFEDLLVQGKYHFSDEAVTTVESDKVLDSLLGVRTDFKDRIAKSQGRD